MTTYVHVAQIPLTLKFEEPHDAVLDHFRELISSGAVHRYEVAPESSVVVNYGVVAAVTVSERCDVRVWPGVTQTVDDETRRASCSPWAGQLVPGWRARK